MIAIGLSLAVERALSFEIELEMLDGDIGLELFRLAFRRETSSAGIGYRTTSSTRSKIRYDYQNEEAASQERLTNHIDWICTTQAIRVMCEDIGSFVDPLNRAGFDIKLLVTEAFPPEEHRVVSRR